MEEKQEDWKLMMFQYSISSFYIGLIDLNNIDDEDKMFNINGALSVIYNEYIDEYVLIEQCEGLGDSDFILNLNKSLTIAVFTPSDLLVNAYKNKMDISDESNLDYEDDIMTTEITTIQ